MSRFAIVLVFISAVLALKARASVTVSHQGNQTQMHFTVEDVVFDDILVGDKTYKRARLVGVDGYEAVRVAFGGPEIPAIRLYVKGAVNVKSVEAQTFNFAKGATWSPSLAPVAKVPGANLVPNDDAQLYADTRFSPEKSFDLSPAGSIRGVAQNILTLYPVAYSPGTGQWTFIKQFDVTIEDPAPEIIEKSPPKYVFVVGEKFAQSAALAKYKAFKATQGFAVEQLNIPTGTRPEAIREKLRAVYKTPDANLRYALIVGDAEDVPGFASSLIDGITDHYYRTLDTDDYMSDYNGPDIGVGRVSAANESQLQAIFDKYIRYSTKTFGDQGWVQRLSFIATNEHYEVPEATHNFVMKNYTAPGGDYGNFPSKGSPGGDKLFAVSNGASTSSVLAQMEEGRSIIVYSGHGDNTAFIYPRVTQDDVKTLKNPDAMPFVIAHACRTGDFRLPESMGESWQRHPYGAITYLGSMGNSLWKEDDLLERFLFEGIFKKGKRTFHEIVSSGMSDLFRYYGGQGPNRYYWETYVTLGDPSIELLR